MEDEGNGVTVGTKMVNVRLDDGTTFYIQAKNLDEEEDVSIMSGSFEKVAKAIEGLAKRFTTIWKAVEPNRASVEFNVEFVWESGSLTAMFVDSSTSASMKITLEWGKPSSNGVQ